MYRLVPVLCLALMVLLCCIPVSAKENSVSDIYGLFSDAEAAELEEACASYSAETGIDAAILTVGYNQAGSYEDMIQYMEDYADRYMGENSIGLIINMDIRYYYVDIKGSEALSVYTDERQLELGNEVVRQLSSGSYAGAGRTFLSRAAQQYEYAHATGTYGTLVQEKEKGFRGGILAGSAVLAALVSALITGMRRGRHSEKHLATDADRYVVPGTVNVYVNRDTFVSQYITRIPRVEQEPKGGGGGFTTTHMSGGGHMHSGHGGKF